MAEVKAEGFLALEASLTTRFTGTAKALLAPLYRKIEAALKQEDWDLATKLALQIDLSQAFDLNVPYISYLSNVTMLFGAARVMADPTHGSVALGFGKSTAELAMQSLRWQLVVSGGKALQDAAVQLIALKKAATLPVPANDGGAYMGTVLKAAKPSAVQPFSSFMDEKGKAFFNVASSLHTSRLSAYGYLAEADVMGITTYQIDEQLDGRTCSMCNYMNGKSFDVEDARGLLDIVIRTQDPDQLKYLQPWPNQSKAGMDTIKGMTPEQLVQNGWHVPPFHPRCRGMLSQYEKARDPNAVPKQLPQPYVADLEDFKQLGVHLSPVRIELWNTLMQTAPSEVMARLTGKSQAEILELLATSKNPMEDLGLVNLSVTQTGVNIELQTPAFGSAKPIKQDLYFRKDQSLYVGWVEVAPGDEAAVKSVLKSLYGLVTTTNMKRLTMTAGADISGYAWAKYGMDMSPSQWVSVKAQVHRTMKTSNLMKFASPLEKQVIDAILASPDPKDVFALADIPGLGEALLSGTTWTGFLDPEVQESIVRFLTHMNGTE